MKKKESNLIFYVLIPVLLLGIVLGLIVLLGDTVSVRQIKTVYELKEEAVLSSLFEIKEKGAALQDEDKRLDTDEVGNYHLEVRFKKADGRVVSKEFDYEVKDTVAPTLRAESRTLIIGTPFDPLSAISACQDYSTITLSYGGTFDTDTPGEYPLTVTATDAYGNAATAGYVLSVIDRETVNGVMRCYFRTDKGFLGYTDEEGYTYIDGCLIVNKTYSFPASFKAEYANMDVVHKLEYLDPTVIEAFKAMRKAMNDEGLSLWMQSGIRVYAVQKILYNSRVQQLGKAGADKISARPGHSEHETGLCFDVNSVSSFETAYPKECKWLMDHAWEYGFCLRYPKGKTNETGYDYEPWHYRYVGQELAQKLWNNGDWLTLEDYFGITSMYAD